MGPGLSCKWSPWARRDVPGPSWAVWCSCSLLLKAVPQVLSPLVCFVSPATSLTKASSALWLLWVFPFCVFSQQVPPSLLTSLKQWGEIADDKAASALVSILVLPTKSGVAQNKGSCCDSPSVPGLAVLLLSVPWIWGKVWRCKKAYVYSFFKLNVFFFFPLPLPSRLLLFLMSDMHLLREKVL